MFWSQHLGCWGQNTSRIQNKGVYATLCLQAELGFCAVICHVESVLTTFGAGLQSACVVDIGHQTASVCCVDDGVSLPQTRIRLGYGGTDIMHCLHWLLHQIEFPYRDCDLASAVDAAAMRELSERICHTNLNDYSVLTPDIFVRKHKLIKYNFKVADQVITAPFGLFLPGLFGVPKHMYAETQPDRVTPPEDAVLGIDNDEYQIMRAAVKESPREDAIKSAKSPSVAKQVGVDLESSDMYTGNSTQSVSFVAVPTGQTGAPALSVVGIDAAVAHSISLCSSEATRKNMYTSILLVGGCALMSGLGGLLEARLYTRAKRQGIRTADHTINVIAKPKGVDPRQLAWKGASVMAQLASSQDCWILRSEYQEVGIRVLREKAPFLW